MSPNLSLQRIASQLPFTYTGADFYALCSDAMLKAVTRQASAVDQKVAAINRESKHNITTAYFFDHYATNEDIAVLVEEEDFIAAQKELIPSVSAKELEHYKRVREQFESVDEKNLEKNGNGMEKKAIPEWQTSLRPKTNGKIKGKAKDKGKGKARVDDIDEEDVPNGFQIGDVGDDEDLY
jgi:peroxin-6